MLYVIGMYVRLHVCMYVGGPHWVPRAGRLPLALGKGYRSESQRRGTSAAPEICNKEFI